MFAQHEIEQFQREGWVAKEEFWSEREVAAMRAELERLKAIGLLRNVATAGDGETPAADRVNLQLCPMFHTATSTAPCPSPIRRSRP